MADIGVIEWGEETGETIRSVLARAEDSHERGATADAAAWLGDYLEQQGPRVRSADAKTAGRKAGHGERALARARSRLKLAIEHRGFPRETWWVDPVALAAMQAAMFEANP